ncbi:MAG: molybdopterin-dependent oxidoreductase [Planctomycetota bacterium]
MDRRTFLTATSTGSVLLATQRLWSRPLSTSTDMLIHTRVPHNAEPRLESLVENWITPTDRFYVRSHAPVPIIDETSFRLSLEGMVERPLSLSVEELKAKFERVTTTATMTCAGNRRSEHSLVKQVKGVPWQAGAIGNATWTGAKLSAVLRSAGVAAEAKHVWFEGLDQIDRPSGEIPFGASIPISKAMSDASATPGALVAYAMNGQPLTPDHGFPMRTVVPGFIGARSVKWLGKIVVSDRPSPNHYVATAYKLVEAGSPQEWATSAPLENFVMNSVTCVPTADANIVAGKLTMRGYALAAGFPDRTIARVEVSADGGHSWTRARFDRDAKPFCWRLWSADLPIAPDSVDIVVRATDSKGEVQPQRVDWNLKGYQFNGWHNTPIQVN